MVQLVAMNEAQFQQFLDCSIPVYAQEKVRAGAWKEEEALRLSQAAFDRLLPDGLSTKNSYLYMVHEPEKGLNIGHIWLVLSQEGQETSAFLYEILIYDAYQGQGYGKQTMAALDRSARELGAASIGLHVFGHNQRALSLYQKSGYAITDYNMKKSL
ncbi:MAG: family acetyltransferase [Paenibacillaceae bacterium]|jgi:GNAT superfamily N-acetyltransferase|nr:family acetyltransferase [Paenibacillaceae bacterium]